MLATSDVCKTEKDALNPKWPSETAGGWWCPVYCKPEEKVIPWAIRTLEIYREQMEFFGEEVLFGALGHAQGKKEGGNNIKVDKLKEAINKFKAKGSKAVSPSKNDKNDNSNDNSNNNSNNNPLEDEDSKKLLRFGRSQKDKTVVSFAARLGNHIEEIPSINGCDVAEKEPDPPWASIRQDLHGYQRLYSAKEANDCLKKHIRGRGAKYVRKCTATGLVGFVGKFSDCDMEDFQ